MLNKNTLTAAVILAGGRGTRMQSTLPKVLHKIAGKPMVLYTLENILGVGIKNISVVVCYRSSQVKKVVSSFCTCKFALQDKPRGTAHALMCALKAIDPGIEKILVANGDDSAFYSPETINRFLSSHIKSKSPISIMTLILSRESQLGRVTRDKEGAFLEILESARYLKSGLKSREINCGAYIFDTRWLRKNIDKVAQSDSGEYYITELPNIAKDEGLNVNLFQLPDEREWVGINTREELKLANRLMKGRLKCLKDLN